MPNIEWKNRFEKFQYQLNGCSECGGGDLINDTKGEYDLQFIESFIETLLGEVIESIPDEIVAKVFHYPGSLEDEDINLVELKQSLLSKYLGK